MKHSSIQKSTERRPGLRSRIIRILAYATVYLILNLIMQFVVSAIIRLADSLRGVQYRNYLLVALNMLITASLYSGVLSNLEGGLEKVTLKVINGFHKFSKAFIGVTGSLLLIYYLLFAAYYWNIFGHNILPGFVVNAWQFLARSFDLYIVQNIQKLWS